MKSQLAVDLEGLLRKVMRRSRRMYLRLLRRYCPASLRNFDKKYPYLGRFKNDTLRIVKFFAMRIAAVIIVIPALIIAIVVISVSKLCSFLKKKFA